MMNRLPPVVGNWYSHRDKGELFQVVALDEGSGTIEIQDFEGDLDELDLEEWRGLQVDEAEQPEDWSGPIDDVEPDELGYTDFKEIAGSEGAAGAEPMTWEEVLEDDDLDELPLH